MKRTESQVKAIKRDLKAGRKITPLQALKDYGCMRLASRIADLRAAGMRIKSKMVFAYPVKYAQYQLQK